MRKPFWTYLACCIAVFMIAMDDLVVTNALPVIRQALPRKPRLPGRPRFLRSALNTLISWVTGTTGEGVPDAVA